MSMSMQTVVRPAIDELCAAFESGGYNPTPIIDLGVLVAAADGSVDEGERAMLSDVFQTLLGTSLSGEVVDHLVTASREVIEAAGAGPRARLVAAILLDCGAVEPGIIVALAVAFASEGYSGAERAVIEGIADAAKLPRARLEELVTKVRAYAVDGPTSVRELLVAKPKP